MLKNFCNLVKSKSRLNSILAKLTLDKITIIHKVFILYIQIIINTNNLNSNNDYFLNEC